MNSKLSKEERGERDARIGTATKGIKVGSAAPSPADLNDSTNVLQGMSILSQIIIYFFSFTPFLPHPTPPPVANYKKIKWRRKEKRQGIALPLASLGYFSRTSKEKKQGWKAP